MRRERRRRCTADTDETITKGQLNQSRKRGRGHATDERGMMD